MRRFFLPAALIILSTILFYSGNNKIGIIPPLGKFLNPYSGFWQNDNDFDIPALPAQHLNSKVEVFFDDRMVPHIFAENDHDLYFTQGFVTAYHRLWQMEFQTLAASGRLSEFLGPALLEYDKFNRKIGIPDAAEKTANVMMQHPEYSKILSAFTEGVNSYISSLSHTDLPFEYKLLDYEPELWKPLKTALLSKMMAWDLTGRNNEKFRTIASNVLSEENLNYMYPIVSPFIEPIIPDQEIDKIKFRNEDIPQIPLTKINSYPDESYYPGSNNWAVSGTKTKSGKPILCNDPHLGLSLPSVWYEIQLHTPEQNVYGVTLPGSPGVIIGFNENISWGVTNAGSDVFDWYLMKFTDSAKTNYEFNGSKLPVKYKKEIYKVKGRTDVVDSVLYTHLGPVPYLDSESPFYESFPQNCAMRWLAHDPSAEGLTFIKLNKAKNYDDFISALDFYTVPAQNFIFADKDGDIAIRHNGKFPIREHAQGRFISDGRNDKSTWEKFIPMNELPSMKNPERGFVSSANQDPVGDSYPYYLGDGYATYERGKRINDLLRENDSIDIKYMKTMQGDSYNIFAERFLKLFFSHVTLDDTENNKAVYDTLKNWQYTNASKLAAPIIFEYLLQSTSEEIWNDNITIDSLNLAMPVRDVTLLTLEENNQSYIDNLTTPQEEDIKNILIMAFNKTCENIKSDLGSDLSKISWGKNRGTVIRHLARVPALGTNYLPTSGNYNTINATNYTHGPSWRMIVSLTDTIEAYGHYPGGQSGNPGSRFYNNFIDDWLDMKYYKLNFYYSKPSGNSEIILTLNSEGK
ncbi:MAG: beta-lactam antibiotic acylase [Melioribacteraceae bacterium]|nr:MAG: beta-lactam antibiotic acylase [Melioribacteraceae bacterium]